MSNELTKHVLASPLSVPPIDSFVVVEAKRTNNRDKILVLEIGIMHGVDMHPRTYEITISNGYADCLDPNPHPTYQDVVIMERFTTADDAGLATAFDQVMGAFFMSQEAGMLAKMAELGIIPAGA